MRDIASGWTEFYYHRQAEKIKVQPPTTRHSLNMDMPLPASVPNFKLEWSKSFCHSPHATALTEEEQRLTGREEHGVPKIVRK